MGKTELKDYDKVLAELQIEIKTENDYNKKKVKLQTDIDSQINLMDANKLGISTVFAFMFTFMFSNILSFKSFLLEEIFKGGIVIVTLFSLFAWMNRDNYKRDYKRKQLNQMLLILELEKENLIKDSKPLKSGNN